MGNVHSHSKKNFNSAFSIGIILNTIFVAVEAFYGWKINSLALLADAGHNLSDVAGLFLAWGGSFLSSIRANAKHTYGWRKGTVLAAFGNAILLLVAMGALGWEAVGRLAEPESTEGMTIIVVAGIGIVINTITALLFMRGRSQDLNIHGAFLHMAADALVSLGVVIGGLITLTWGWKLVDPIMSLSISVIIIWGTWNLFRQSLHLLFDGVPESINLLSVSEYLQSLPEVKRVLDLHIWALGTSEFALTAHLITPSGHPPDTFYQKVATDLHDRFEIDHVTIQCVTSLVDESS